MSRLMADRFRPIARRRKGLTPQIRVRPLSAAERLGYVDTSAGRELMIDAAIVGLGWWGKNLVNAVQGKSERLRFIRGVSKEPDTVRDVARAHGFELSSDLADVLS